MKISNEGYVEKGWGYELIWASNEKYCGKVLVFKDVGSKFSMHFHKNKEETWFVNFGKFKVTWIETDTATYKEKILNEGDTWHNPPLQPHQLECLIPNSSISEVSTHDDPDDNYRILPGDSQKVNESNA